MSNHENGACDTYVVIIKDNFHYQDSEVMRVLPGFLTAADALAKCQSMVEICLAECAEPGSSAEAIFGCYQMYGDDPWIRSPCGKPEVRFSAWEYAQEQAHRFVCSPEAPAAPT